jgi:hypothetical protein
MKITFQDAVTFYAIVNTFCITVLAWRVNVLRTWKRVRESWMNEIHKLSMADESRISICEERLKRLETYIIELSLRPRGGRFEIDRDPPGQVK